MKRILVINPFGLGDVIFTMTLVEALRKAKPDAMIGFLCNERTVDLVRLNTSIDHTFIFNRDRLRRLWKKHPLFFVKKIQSLLKLIREFQFDMVFDLSLGREYSFFCWWIGIKKRMGLDYKSRGIFLTHKIKVSSYCDRAVTDTQLALLRKMSIPFDKPTSILPLRVSAIVKNEVNDFLRKKGVLDEDILISIAPGGGRS